jgi:cytochrome b subunit of formate dehydrogenase
LIRQERSLGGTDPARAPVVRNGRKARWLHTLVYLSTLLLAYSGIALLLEGHPGLARPLGGHVPTATSHRLVGYGLLIFAALVAIVWWRAAGRFVANSVRFSRLDLGWLAGYPRMALRPGRAEPAPHRGHFDPGQRVFNLLLVLIFLVLGVTGIVMGMPERFLPSAFGWSLRIHKLATWVLLGLVAGHLLLASGLLPGYRGIWRAMHLGGRVPAATARRLWPLWSTAPQRQRVVAHSAGGARQPSTDQLEERGARRQQ